MAFGLQTLLACGLCVAVLALATAPCSAGVLAPGHYPSGTAGALVKSAGKDQSVIIGSVGFQDPILLTETVYKESIALIVRDADLVYPKQSEIGRQISCIEVLDQRKDGKNGEVKVKEGGLGSNYVKLRFHSQRGKSLNYLVKIYGH